MDCLCVKAFLLFKTVKEVSAMKKMENAHTTDKYIESKCIRNMTLDNGGWFISYDLSKQIACVILCNLYYRLSVLSFVYFRDFSSSLLSFLILFSSSVIFLFKAHREMHKISKIPKLLLPSSDNWFDSVIVEEISNNMIKPPFYACSFVLSEAFVNWLFDRKERKRKWTNL